MKKLDDGKDKMPVTVSEEDAHGSTLVGACQQMEKLDNDATRDGTNEACEVTNKMEQKVQECKKDADLCNYAKVKRMESAWNETN